MSNFKKRRIRSQRPSFTSGMLINFFWIATLDDNENLIKSQNYWQPLYSVSSSISSRLSTYATVSEASTPSSAVRISRFPTRRQSTPNIGHVNNHHNQRLQIKRRSYPRRYSRSEILLLQDFCTKTRILRT